MTSKLLIRSCMMVLLLLAFQSKNGNEMTINQFNRRYEIVNGSIKDSSKIVYQTSENNNEVKRYENITFNWELLLPTNYSEQNVHAQYYLNDSLSNIIINTSQDGGIQSFDIDKSMSTSYVHFINGTFPIFTECRIKGSYERKLNITVTIYFMRAPIELGEYSFTFLLISPDKSEIIMTKESKFIITDDYIFDIGWIFVKSNNSWVNISTLSPSIISPGEELFIVGYLKDTSGKIPPKSELPQNYYTTVKLAGYEFNESSFFYNQSIHEELPIIANDSMLITNIKIPLISIRSDVLFQQRVSVGYKWKNGTINESFEIICPEVKINCDYKVRADILNDLPKSIMISEELKLVMPLYTVKMFNESEKISGNFSIQNVQIKCFLMGNETVQEEKELTWVYNAEINELVINENSFGAPLFKPAYPTGLYKINASWGNNEKIRNSQSENTTIEFLFQMKESFDIFLFYYSSGRLENITTNDVGKNVTFTVKLIHKTTGKEVYGRKFWLGTDESNRWVLEKQNYGYGWKFNQPLDLSNKNITLFTWVECSNGSVVKLDRTVEVYYIEETNSTNSKKTQSSGLILSLLGLIVLIRKKSFLF